MTDETDRKVRDAMISIHTPAKGVTGYQPVKIMLSGISIHTPAKGVTERQSLEAHKHKEFQSTLPRRE